MNENIVIKTEVENFLNANPSEVSNGFKAESDDVYLELARTLYRTLHENYSQNYQYLREVTRSFLQNMSSTADSDVDALSNAFSRRMDIALMKVSNEIYSN